MGKMKIHDGNKMGSFAPSEAPQCWEYSQNDYETISKLENQWAEYSCSACMQIKKNPNDWMMEAGKLRTSCWKREWKDGSLSKQSKQPMSRYDIRQEILKLIVEDDEIKPWATSIDCRLSKFRRWSRFMPHLRTAVRSKTPNCTLKIYPLLFKILGINIRILPFSWSIVYHFGWKQWGQQESR